MQLRMFSTALYNNVRCQYYISIIVNCFSLYLTYIKVIESSREKIEIEIDPQKARSLNQKKTIYR